MASRSGYRRFRHAGRLVALLGLGAVGQAYAFVEFATPPSWVSQQAGKVIVNAQQSAAAGISFVNGVARGTVAVGGGSVATAFSIAPGAAGRIAAAARVLGPIGVGVATVAWMADQGMFAGAEGWETEKPYTGNCFKPGFQWAGSYMGCFDSMDKACAQTLLARRANAASVYFATSPGSYAVTGNVCTTFVPYKQLATTTNWTTVTNNHTINPTTDTFNKRYPAQPGDWIPLEAETNTEPVPDEVANESPEVEVVTQNAPSTFVPTGAPYPKADPAAPWEQPGNAVRDRPLTPAPFDFDVDPATRPADNPDTPEDESPAPENPGTPTPTEDAPTDCDKLPNSVGCTDFGEAPSDQVATGQREVAYQAEALGLPAGCPAPISVNGYTISFETACDAAPTVRALVLGLAGVMALMICVAAVRGS